MALRPIFSDGLPFSDRFYEPIFIVICSLAHEILLFHDRLLYGYSIEKKPNLCKIDICT